MTARSVPEWIGKTPDSQIPPRVRIRTFIKVGGYCQCGCGQQIRVGDKWDCDHIVALINGGEHRESNLQLMLSEHHKGKTKDDVAVKAKSNRVRARHLGVRKRSTLPGGRDSPWRKKIDGTVVRR